MSLDPRALEELEKRGPHTVRAMLAIHYAVGVGHNPVVPLGLGEPGNPTRSDVENWLREKDEAAAKLSTQRHEEQLTEGRRASFWARAAFWAAVVLVLMAALAMLDHLSKQG